MTNAELLAKIKAEIDKRYAEYREKMKSDDFTYYEGMADALDLFEQFIDSLESEKPINPDAAMKELDEKIALVKQRGTWDGIDVDKYMDEVRGREPEKPIDLEEEINRFEDWMETYNQADYPTSFTTRDIARYFYDLGCRRTAEKADEIEYNRQRAEECVPNDLEEASSKFATHTASNGVSVEFLEEKLSFQEGAKWQKEQDEILKVNYEGARTVYDNTVQHLQEKIDEKYELGKKDMKEQMLKEAVEGEIVATAIGHLRIVAEANEKSGVKDGDKVRIIIVKED